MFSTKHCGSFITLLCAMAGTDVLIHFYIFCKSSKGVTLKSILTRNNIATHPPNFSFYCKSSWISRRLLRYFRAWDSICSSLCTSHTPCHKRTTLVFQKGIHSLPTSHDLHISVILSFEFHALSKYPAKGTQILPARGSPP